MIPYKICLFGYDFKGGSYKPPVYANVGDIPPLSDFHIKNRQNLLSSKGNFLHVLFLNTVNRFLIKTYQKLVERHTNRQIL